MAAKYFVFIAKYFSLLQNICHRFVNITPDQKVVNRRSNCSILASVTFGRKLECSSETIHSTAYHKDQCQESKPSIIFIVALVTIKVNRSSPTSMNVSKSRMGNLTWLTDIFIVVIKLANLVNLVNLANLLKVILKGIKKKALLISFS